MNDLKFAFEHLISPQVLLKANGEIHFSDTRNLFAIFGESGCGKTTLLKLILGIKKEKSGRIRLGQDLLQDENNFVPCYLRSIGYVPQRECLFPYLDVKDNILYSLHQHSPQDKLERLFELLQLFKIENLKDRKMSEISGGQKQRVSLARAVANCPKLLLMDEALNHLDLKSRKSLLPELADWLQQLNLPTIFVSHDEQDAALLGAKIFEFKEHVLEINPVV